MSTPLQPLGPPQVQWSLQAQLQAGVSHTAGLQRLATEPAPGAQCPQEAVLQQGLPAEAGAPALPASPSLTVMALTSLYGHPAHWHRRVVHQEAEHRRPPSAPPEEEDPSGAPEAAQHPRARAPGQDVPTRARHGRILDRLRSEAHLPAVAEALQQLRAGRPVLLAAATERLQRLSGDACAWLLWPDGPSTPVWRGRVLLARLPAAPQWWGWHAVADLHPQGGAQWRAREPRGGCELWLGLVAQGAACTGWREALLCLPAAPTLRRALRPLHSLRVLLTTAPWGQELPS
ncbi:MAG: hypothetical protein AB1430_07555 [Pseudomonadota bacterium]